MGPPSDRPRFLAYLLLVLCGLIAGLALGSADSRGHPGRSRIAWPVHREALPPGHDCKCRGGLHPESALTD